MLWYKSWLETRWRFLIGLGLLICSALSVVFIYPEVIRLVPLAPTIDVGGELGRRVQESVELSKEYRGYRRCADRGRAPCSGTTRAAPASSPDNPRAY